MHYYIGTLVDGQGAVELEVAPTSEGYSVKWNTHHTFYVDYINLEAVCSIQGKESTVSQCGNLFDKNIKYISAYYIGTEYYTTTTEHKACRI